MSATTGNPPGRPKGSAAGRSAHFVVRIKPELLARLDATCHERVVGRNLVIEMALTRWLDGLEPLA